MNWSSAREKLMHLAGGVHPLNPSEPRALGERGLSEAPAAFGAPAERASCGPRPPSAAAGARLRASSLCIASGKGGTGKSVVSASLGSVLAGAGRTLLVDADLGVGNAHILQDVSPEHSLVEVALGERAAREVLVACTERLDLLAGGSGVPRVASLAPCELCLVAAGLEELEPNYRYLLVDSAAGLSRQTLAFAAACDLVLIVTTPDLTAMTDAYAFLKVLHARDPERRPLLLVNRASDTAEAQEVAERIERVSRRFLSCALELVGWLPEDPAVARCVNRRSPVVALEAHAPFAVALRETAVRLLAELEARRPRGAGARLLELCEEGRAS